jgi:hypothetical protein
MERFATIVLCLAGLGGLSIWYGGRELATTLRSSEKPERMKLSELIARGRDGNPHVEVTDFKEGKQFASIRKKDAFIGDGYVPLIPDGAPVGAVAIHKTISMTVNFRSDEPKSISGMVISEPRPKEAKRLLETQYPLLNFDDPIIIDMGHPEPASYGWKFIGIGVALIVPLPLVFYLAHRKDQRNRQAAKALYDAGLLPNWNNASRPSGEPANDNETIRYALEAERRQSWDEALAEWGKLASSDNTAITTMAREHMQAIQAKREGGSPRGEPGA